MSDQINSKSSSPNPKNTGFWDSLQEEMDRLRSFEKQKQETAVRSQEWMEQQIKLQDLEMLQTLLRMRLGIVYRPTTNPDNVEGLWFGVRRIYHDEFEEYSHYTSVAWQIHLYRACNRCNKLRPSFHLADPGLQKTAEKRGIVDHITGVKDALLNRDKQQSYNIRKLARFLHEIKTGRHPNPWDGPCPNCEAPGTLPLQDLIR